MKNFKSGNRTDRGGTGKRFGNSNFRGRGFGNRDGGRPEMHKATCAECGSPCEVPFRPSGDKPIYCSNCFKSKGGDDHRRSGGGKSFGKPSFGEKKMFSAVCDDCGQPCEVPFQPSGDKPIYCRECFGSKNSSQSRPANNNDDQLGRRLDGLNAKMDEIIKMLSSTVAVKPAAKAVIVKPVVKAKAIKKTTKPVVKKSTAKKKKK